MLSGRNKDKNKERTDSFTRRSSIIFFLLLNSSSLFGQWNLSASSILGTFGRSYSPYLGCGAMSFREGTIWAGITKLEMSADTAKTWSYANFTVPNNGDVISDVKFFDADNGILTLVSGGIYMTNNRGATWVKKTVPISAATAVAYFGTVNDIVIVGGPGQMCLTRNGGSSWTSLSSQGIDGFDVCSPSPGKIIATGGRLYVSTDYGATWQRGASRYTYDAWSIGIDRCDPNRIYVVTENFVGTSSDVIATQDNGNNFQTVYAHPSSYYVGYLTGSIAISQHAMYCPSLYNGILRSTDQGATWISIGGPVPKVDARLILAFDNNTVVAADGNGSVWVTNNSGGFPIQAITQIKSLGQLQLKQCDLDTIKVVISGIACNMLQISNALLEGADASFFALDNGIFPFDLTAGRSDTLQISFDPSKTNRSFFSTLKITITDPLSGLSYDTIISITAIVTPQPPMLFSNPSTINFDTVSICDMLRDSLLQLTNHGCDTLNIISGPGGLAPGFTADPLLFPIILPPDSSVFVRFHFDPTLATTYQTDAQFTADHKGLKQNVVITLKGRGVGNTQRQVLDSVLYFNSVSICNGYQDTTIDIINTGCDTLTILSGPGSLGTGFTFDSLSLPLKIPPDSIISITFHFRPAISGGFQAIATFTIIQAGNIQDINLQLNGLGIVPKPGPIILDNKLTFIPISPCDTTRDSVVVFTNRGCDTLRILSGPGNLNPQFDADGLTYPIVIPPDSSIVVHVHFHASKIGTYQTQATYQTQRSGSKPENVVLTLIGKNNGTSGGPIVLTTSFIFDTISLCGSGHDTSIVFTNNGCDTLKILSGPGNLGAGFSTDQLTYPIIIPPDSSVTIIFHFDPTSSGDFTGYPHFVTERSGQQSVLDLFLQGSAKAGGSIFSLITPSLSFTPLSICSSDSLEIVYTNIGCDSVFVTPIGTTGDADFSASAGIEEGIPAKDSIHIRVVLHPQQQGQRTATYVLRLRDRNGVTRDTQITITGFVTAGSTTLKLSDSVLTFGATTLCASPDTTMTLYNRGCDTLWVTDLTLTGSGFSINEPTPFFILPGENQQITIHTVLDTVNKQSSSNGVIKITSNSQDPLPPIILSRGYIYPKAYTIRLEMPITRAGAGDTIVVRVIADSLPTDVTTVTAALQVANTDLLTYLFTVSDNTVTVTPTNVMITGSPITAINKILAELYYKVFLTKDTTTVVSLSNAQFNPGDSAYENCIATAAALTGTGFSYEFACGEHLVGSVIRGEVLRLLSISPNPTSGSITLAIESPAEQQSGVEVYDMLGKKVFTEGKTLTRGKNSLPIDTKVFARGMYSVILKSQSGSITTTFVKE